MSEHSDAVRNYRWLWSMICNLFHSKHHGETSSGYYRAVEYRCEKCGRVWIEEDF